MFFRLAVVFFLLSAATAQAESGCTLKRLLTLTSRPHRDGLHYVPASLGDQRTHLLISTGTVWGAINKRMADALGLKPKSTLTYDVYFVSATGKRTSGFVSVPSVKLGDMLLAKRADFLTEDGYDNSDIAANGGSIGLNILQHFDLEIDNANRTVILFDQDHCRGVGAYWTDAWAEFPIRFRENGSVVARMVVDGEDVDGMIATGRVVTRIDIDFARRHLGFSPTAPGVTRIPDTSTTGEAIERYNYRVKSLTVSGVRFENVPVEVVDMKGMKLILGMNELKHLHLYFAFKEKKVYVTAADARYPR